VIVCVTLAIETVKQIEALFVWIARGSKMSQAPFSKRTRAIAN